MSDKNIFFLHFQGKGTTGLHSSELSSFLIENANAFLDQKNAKKIKVTNDDILQLTCHHYLKEYLKKGESKSFLDELNRGVSNLKFQVILNKTKKDRKSELVPVWNENRKPTIDEIVLYPLMCAIHSGDMSNLRECKNKECSRFFLGRKNKKWCSDRCGSKLRMKNKRRKDYINKQYN